MSNISNSTVTYKSNIQIIKEGYILKDNNFLSYIRDPFALEKLERCIRMKETNYAFSDIQKNEYERSSLHCSFAKESDYPWGTIINEAGIEKVVCRCINVECLQFRTCRPDFNEDELMILNENETINEEKLLRKEKIESKLFNHKDEKEELVNISRVLIYDSNDETENNKDESYKEELYANNEEGNDAYKEEINETNRVKNDDKILKKTGFDSFIPVEQSEYICADSDRRIVINAGPGTGKTYAVIEKIINLLEEHEAEGDTILILCFSRAAVEVVQKRLKQASEDDRAGIEINNVEIRTFDSFATYLISWVQENYEDILPCNYKMSNENYEDRIRTAVEILTEKTDIFEEYTHVIVDEVQDLVGIRAELVLKILEILPKSCGFTLLGDACQAIYDYQVNTESNEMSSVDFYYNIFSRFSDADYYSFEKNHRQSGDIDNMLKEYRNGILTGESADRRKTLNKIYPKIETEVSIDLQHPEKKEFNKYIEKGKTLGILTRTNGQALKISTWLRNGEINHMLRKPLSSEYISEWVGRIFTEYDYDTVNNDSFIEAFKKIYPNENISIADEYWNALVRTQFESKSRYTVEELLLGVMKNSRDKCLFSGNIKNSEIVVSNIHRAKGMEFDTVFLFDEMFKNILDNEADNEIEHKVSYVALTRAKSDIKNVDLKPMFIHISKKGDKRCYKTGRKKANKKPPLTEIEIGLKGDISESSFASEITLQNLIKYKIKKGQALQLKLSRGEDKKPEFYDILDDENENLILGKTSHKFIKELSTVLKEIFTLPKSAEVFNDFYPDKFSDLYVDQIVTFISTDIECKPGAKIYGSVCIWNGFTVSGFARKVNDRY